VSRKPNTPSAGGRRERERKEWERRREGETGERDRGREGERQTERKGGVGT